MSSWLSALPVGLILFAGMAIGLLLRRARHRAARQEFPDLAHRLGLELRPPSHPSGIGKLAGVYQGYRVFVDPDDQRRITVRFDRAPGICFRTYDDLRRPPSGLVLCASGRSPVDAFFKTRYASPEVVDRIAEARDLARRIAPLTSRYRRAIRQVSITSEAVTCDLDFGNPPHVPLAAVEDLLPALVDLARVIEPHDRG